MNKAAKPRKKSLILGFLDGLEDKCNEALSKSVIGNFFTSYDKATDAFEKSGSYSAAKKLTNSDWTNKIRSGGAGLFDRSFLRKAVLGATSALRHCTVRFYGVMLLTFSLYVVLMYLIRRFGMFYTAPMSYIVVSIVTALISLPLVFEKEKTLGAALLESKFFSWLLFDFFELRYENFRNKSKPIRRTSVAFILGMVFGCLTFFVSPVALILVGGLVLFFYVSLVSPEASLLISLFSIPFLSYFDHPTAVLGVLVGCMIIGYTVKVFRRKRLFYTGILETFVLLFMLVLFFSATRNASGAVSADALGYVVLLCGFFLSANLLRTKSMIMHAVRAFALSSVVCAFYGIAEYFLGRASFDWLDADMFGYISGRAVSFFENPNVLGTYLCFGAPLTLALMSISHAKNKTRWFVGFVAIVICSVLTWSRGTWIGLAVSVFMMIACNKRLFSFSLCSLLCIPFASYLIPSGITERVMSIGDMADSSTMYRLNIWRGCFDMLGEYGIAGIGTGDAAFARLYPKYAVSGAETAYHSHSLWMQLLLTLGICGFVIFLLMMMFFYQKSLTSLKNNEDRELKHVIAASMSGVSGLLVAGLFDYTWYNYRVYFVFFMIMGFVSACNRTEAESRGGFYE